MTRSERASAHTPTLSTQRAVIPHPDPAVAELLELRLALAKVPIEANVSPERLEEARNTLRELGRNANHAIRAADVRHAEDAFARACFAARAQIAEARGRLAVSTLDSAELTRARRALYRGLCLVAEALAATTTVPKHAPLSESLAPGPKSGVLFAAFVTQVAVATRANSKDVAWILEVADQEISVTAGHPHFEGIPAEQRTMLRSLRGEVAAWSGGDRSADTGYALLNRLVLLVDCLNH